MAELVLHAGIQKTGSTFLQRNLKANRAHLNAAGLGYIHYTEIKRSPWWRYIVDGRSVNRRAALASLAETLETLLDENGRFAHRNEAGAGKRKSVPHPDWPPEMEAVIRAWLAPDAAQLLAHIGKPTDYWAGLQGG
jgi:hypothetical protein